MDHSGDEISRDNDEESTRKAVDELNRVVVGNEDNAKVDRSNEEEENKQNQLTENEDAVFIPMLSDAVATPDEEKAELSQQASDEENIYPLPNDDDARPELPLHSASYFSLMSIHWMNGFMWKTFKKKSLTENDMWKLSYLESADVNGRSLQRLWNVEVGNRGLQCASLTRVIARFCIDQIPAAVVVNIFNFIFTFAAPALMFRSILAYASSPQNNILLGLTLALCLLACDMGRMLSFMMQIHLGFVLSVRMRCAVMYLVYDKLLKLRSLKNKSVGEFVNYFANDCQRLYEFMVILPMMLSGPLMAVASTIYCVVYIGRWALLGAVVIGLYYPYQFVISRLTTYVRRKAVLITDNRIRMISELLVCIRLIKLYAWEMSFAKAVSAVRAKEKSFLQKAAFLQTMSSGFTPLVAVYAGVFTVIGHVMSGNELSVQQAFVCIAVYNVTRLKLAQMPYLVRVGAEAYVGLKRAEEILRMEELDRNHFSRKPADHGTAIEILNGTFAWDSVKRDPTDKEKRQAASFCDRKEKNGVLTTKSAKNGRHANDHQQANNNESLLKVAAEKADENHAAMANEMCIDVLFNINFVVPKGKLYGICGSVGSGKSSLLSAALGQMVIRSGTFAIDGEICYVPQQAWILNATLKDNILFGLPYNRRRYNDVIDRCCLKSDIEMLPAGDSTEIGERGVTLSGGQKQRVSIARAMYGECDVFLLDDPLSAVDGLVGEHLFKHCLLRASRVDKRTVVFVTHQIQYLNECDAVAVIKDGSIIEFGTHNKLMADKGHYSHLVNTFYSEKEQQNQDAENDEDPTEIHSNSSLPRIKSDPIGSQLSLHKNRSSGKLIDDEKSEGGSVTWNTYWTYIQAAGGAGIAILVLLIFAIPVACASFTDWWLSRWLTERAARLRTETIFDDVMNSTTSFANVTENVPLGHVTRTFISPDYLGDSFYATVYAVFALSIVVAVCFRGLVTMLVTLRASSRLHDNFLKKILTCSMSFFNVTPVGRLLNRFSKDIDESVAMICVIPLQVDITSSPAGRSCVNGDSPSSAKRGIFNAPSGITTMTSFPACKTPHYLANVDNRLPANCEELLQNGFLVLFAIVMIAIGFPWFLFAMLLPFILFLIMQHIARFVMRETKRLENVSRSPLLGLVATTVHGLQSIHACNKESEFFTKFKASVDLNTADTLHFCYATRWLSFRLDCLSSLITFLVAIIIVSAKAYVTPAYASLALVYSAKLTGLFQYTVRLASDAEARFTSVERVKRYMSDIEEEAPAVIPSRRPRSTWPEDGAITYEDYSMRYRHNLPFVLKGITCRIESRHSVGIVGRTGSGKTSLVSAIFRLVEPASGSITIDGVDISTIGLRDLRSKLSIIPQDPVLFTGTIRYNLDPFNERTDSDIWLALEKCYMKEKIKNAESGLNVLVIENGDNFSVGERQLLCMARALLRRSKILVMDEATAAVDTETDAAIQLTIGEAFTDCTTLIIAHRLNTVLHCDRLLVLDRGQVAEFDSPGNLLQNPKSLFAEMLQRSEMKKTRRTHSRSLTNK